MSRNFTQLDSLASLSKCDLTFAKVLNEVSKLTANNACDEKKVKISV
jgi:hypothetical protein